MIQSKFLVVLMSVLLLCGSMSAQDVSIDKRMKEADPKNIGTRVVNKFIVTPHTRFGNPRAEKAPNYITYPDACAWLGALWFSKTIQDKDMQRKLKERFEPLFTTEKHLIPRMNHVDLTALRLAVYEMKMDEDVPVGVAINEAVELAKLFGGEDSGSFVNGILGKIASGKKDSGEEPKRPRRQTHPAKIINRSSKKEHRKASEESAE